MFFWCLQIFQKTNEIFSRISSLAYKKRSNQKISALYTTNWRILFRLSYTTFLITPLFRGKGRNPGKKIVVFLEHLKTPKGHFEINWSLAVFSKYWHWPILWFVHRNNFEDTFSHIFLYNFDNVLSWIYQGYG